MIIWLPILLEVLGNMFIAIVCFAGCEAINFEINLIFLIKAIHYITKKSRQKYLETKKSFWGEIKSIFHHFWKAFSCNKLSQTWECAFNPFSTNVPLLYFLKISENVRFCEVFRVYRSGTLVENGLKSIIKPL